jgi:outer membrane protein assembly factor BamB
VLLLASAQLSCVPKQIVRPGCGKDTDCKGTRVCVAGACVEPQARPATPPPPTTPPTVAPSEPAAPPLANAGSQFHGDPHHTGRYAGKLPSSAPHEVMRFTTNGTVYSGVAVARGLAIFGSHDRGLYAVALEPPPPRMLALAPQDLGPADAADAGSVPDAGAPSPFSPRWRRDLGDLIWATPAVVGDTVYAGSDADALVAIDVRTGEVRWRLPTGPCRIKRKVGPEGARCDVDGIAVAPDGTLYAAADGLYAVRPDGTLKWKFSPGTTHCATAPAIADDGTLYLGCQDDTLYAITAEGQKRWDVRTGDDVDSSPAIGPDGTIYFGSDDRKLWAVSPEGKIRFSVITSGAVRSSPAIGADGTVYVGSFDGNLYAIQPGGTVRWTYRAADRIVSSPIVDADGAIAFGSQDDRLYALEPDGRLRWSVQLDGDVDGTPTLLDDGTLLVGADDRALHVLR